MSVPPEAMASSMDRTGAVETAVPVRPGVERAGKTEEDAAFVGEGGDASGLVAPIPRERILMPGT